LDIGRYSGGSGSGRKGERETEMWPKVRIIGTDKKMEIFSSSCWKRELFKYWDADEVKWVTIGYMK
jgi:hypothetical protein